MNIYYRLTIASRKDKKLYHHPASKESIYVTSNYVGIESIPNTFIGIDSITTLENKPIKNNVSKYSAFAYSSQVCIIFPIIEVMSAVVVAILFYIFYTQNKLIYGIGAFVALLLFTLVMFFFNKYMEGIFLTSIPKKYGWIQAYIDDYGDISYPDEKTGKVIPISMHIGGKTRIHMATKQEAEIMENAFFSKK